MMARVKNNIWFDAGDKVMRVGDSTPGVPVIHYPHGTPKYGKVYCVSKCFKSPSGKYNQVWLAGFSPCYGKQGQKVGWSANAFRRVEEIRLCVAAVKHSESTVLQARSQ